MDLQALKNIYKGKRVFLTGHTGFKGAWLLQMLHWLGADVKGYALAPENSFDLYNEINGDKLCYASVTGDLRDQKLVMGELVRFQPHFVFHLGAQSLVRRSYEQPVETFAVNAMGTAHVLEAMRALEEPCVGVMITTDKVYENPERGEAFKEDDKLGGYDPYSASKAATEIVIDSYRRSFFNSVQYDVHRKAIASVRAGNVIGGGDFAADRIIPDIIRAIKQGQQVNLRNPHSVRPWQHVIEPLVAYLLLGAKMHTAPQQYCTAYNIGPEQGDETTVEKLTQIFLKAFGNQSGYSIQPQQRAPHEAKLLMLDNRKLKTALGWEPKLNSVEAIEWTAEWYADREHTAAEKCMSQIERYFAL